MQNPTQHGGFFILAQARLIIFGSSNLRFPYFAPRVTQLRLPPVRSRCESEHEQVTRDGGGHARAVAVAPDDRWRG